MVQGTTPTLLFKFSFDLALAKEWRIAFYQDEETNFVKTQADCIVDENQVIYIKLTQEETLSFDVNKYLKIQAKALTNDNNVISSDTIATHVHEILDKALFEIENTPPTIIDTSVIEFHFNEEHCQYGLDFEDLYIEKVGSGGGSDITVDKELSTTSTNPVQNRTITTALNNKQDKLTFDETPTINSTNLVTSGGIAKEINVFANAMNVMFNNVNEHIQQYEQKVDDLEANKQNKLTFDAIATENSTNSITSGGVYNSLQDYSQQQNSYIERTLGQFETYMDEKHISKDTIETEVNDSENPVSSKAVYDKFEEFSQSQNQEYELIASLTVVPDTDGGLPNSIKISTDSDGNAFELTDFYVEASCAITKGNLGCLLNNSYVFGNATVQFLANTNLRAFALCYRYYGENEGGQITFPAQTVGSSFPNSNDAGWRLINIPPNFKRESSYKWNSIKAITLICTTTTETFINGSTFKLWGKRK